MLSFYNIFCLFFLLFFLNPNPPPPLRTHMAHVAHMADRPHPVLPIGAQDGHGKQCGGVGLRRDGPHPQRRAEVHPWPLQEGERGEGKKKRLIAYEYDNSHPLYFLFILGFGFVVVWRAFAPGLLIAREDMETACFAALYGKE